MGAENSHELGTIEVAVGPMFADKTGWLGIKVAKHLHFKNPALIVTHILEAKRAGVKTLKSRNGLLLPCENASSADEIYNLMLARKIFDRTSKPRTLAIDEMQFFDTKLALLAVEAQRNGIRVFAAGLDQYFNEEFCPTSAAMMAVATSIEKLASGCDVCGLDSATRTQMLIDGQPAPYNSPKVAVGDKNPLKNSKVTYGARCLNHHIVPGKPNFK
ncbi:hypothetical protein HYW46_04005 [Candidatus Daviesbacteria bacterium]|nr:hypothetical protein [Candidatus Daviesbacteria bacterium]